MVYSCRNDLWRQLLWFIIHVVEMTNGERLGDQ